MDDHFLAAFKTGNGAGGRGGILKLGMDFVIHVGVESAEAIRPGVVGDVGFYGQGAHIFQVDDGAGKRRVLLVHDRAADGAQLRVALFLRARCGRRQQHGEHGRHDDPRLSHFGFPPDAGASRKTRSWRFPALVSSFRVCSWYPFAATLISYSAPRGSRTANSPRRSERASLRVLRSPERRTRISAPGRAKPCSVKTVPDSRKSSSRVRSGLRSVGLEEDCA